MRNPVSVLTTMEATPTARARVSRITHYASRITHHSATPLPSSPSLPPLDPPLFLEPENAVPRPGMPFGWIILQAAQAQAVLAFLIDVQVERDACLPQRGGKLQAVFHRHGLVFVGVPDEAGRGGFGDLEFVGQFTRQFLRRMRPQQVLFRAFMGELAHGDDGVTKDAKVRTGALAFDGIGRSGLAGVEMGQQGGSQMAAGRRTNDADAPGVHLPFSSA